MFDAVPQHPVVPLMQSPGYARAAALMGITIEEVPFVQQGFRAGHALMQSRWVPVLGWIGLISRGPLWAGLPDATLLAMRLKALGHPVIVNVDGILAHDLRQAGFVPVMSAATVAQLDISGDHSARRARMHQKWRNRLVRAENSRLKVMRERLSGDPAHWLLQAEHRQRSARGYKGLPPEFAAAYAQANPDMAQVFTAWSRGEIVASMLFLQHGTTATYHIGHTTEDGRKLNAHSLLMARACDWLADNGVDLLELGSLDTLNAPGLARFKLGTGAKAHELGGSWLYAKALVPFGRWAF